MRKSRSNKKRSKSKNDSFSNEIHYVFSCESISNRNIDCLNNFKIQSNSSFKNKRIKSNASIETNENDSILNLQLRQLFTSSIINFELEFDASIDFTSLSKSTQSNSFRENKRKFLNESFDTNENDHILNRRSNQLFMSAIISFEIEFDALIVSTFDR